MARLKGVPRALGHSSTRAAQLGRPGCPGIRSAIIYLTGGIVTIEYLFAYPGFGSALARAVRVATFRVVQAIVLLLAGIYVLFNLVADLLTILLVAAAADGPR